MKLVALGVKLYLKDRWNQLDVAIVFLSIVGIVLEELESKIIPINPTIIRVMRVLRIARGISCRSASMRMLPIQAFLYLFSFSLSFRMAF